MQAIILAGGRGERLRPYTDDRPKPMVEVNGVPLIAYALGWLQEHGIADVILACGYRWQILQRYLGDGAPWRLNISYAVEQQKLGRGGGIRFAAQHLRTGTEPVVVANGDNIVDIDLAPLLAQHEQTGALITDVVVPLISSRGIVEIDDRDRIVHFLEKPELPHWINAGIYVFSRAALEMLPVQGDHEDLLFPRLAAEGRLYAYRTRELWRTVDTAKDLATLAEELTRALSAPCLAIPPVEQQS